MKRTFCAALAASVTLLLSGCRDAVPAMETVPAGTVRLTVWGADEDNELLKKITEEFKAEYADEADLKISVQRRGETDCKAALLANPMNGADVFTFQDECLPALAAAGILSPVKNSGSIAAECVSGAAEAASVGSTLYAYPLTADNVCFLYYNKAYFSAEDVKSLDSILHTAAEKDKLFLMDWRSARCVYSFFGCTGLRVGLNSDGITNYCDWNRTDAEISGADVLRSMTAVVESGGFVNGGDTAFLDGAADGSVIAGVGNIGLSEALEKIWGEDFGAAALPVYSCGENQVQMASVTGGRLIGVNAYSDEPYWSARLAEWITSEKNQLLRFEMLRQYPANSAAAAEAARKSEAAAALAKQSDNSQLLRVGESFNAPVRDAALCIAAGNPPDANLQKIIDNMVLSITKH